MNKLDIELAVVSWLGIRRNLVVPNVSWGLNLHECDVLALSRANYATEVEIKISVGDLRRDAKKRHRHADNRIAYLWFALPAELRYDVADIPDRAGIVHVGPYVDGYGVDHGLRCSVVRESKRTMLAQPFTAAERLHLAELGCMRVWNLKRKLSHSLGTS